MAEQKEEKKYRATANVLTAGDKKDYFKGQVISEGEYKQLAKEVKKKFEEVQFLPLLSGTDQKSIAQTIQNLEVNNAALQGDLNSARKEIDDLKKQLKPSAK
jgi:hypothetical protein